MNKASTVLSLLNVTGLAVEEAKKTESDDFDSSKFYVWDNSEEDIVAGPFDSEEEAKKAVSGDSQEVVCGSEFDSEEGEDDEYEEEYVIKSADEAMPTKMVSFSGGKKHIKLVCEPGFKLDGKACVKMDAKELASRKKAAMKAARKRRGKSSAASKAAAKTMAKRAAAGL